MPKSIIISDLSEEPERRFSELSLFFTRNMNLSLSLKRNAIYVRFGGTIRRSNVIMSSRKKKWAACSKNRRKFVQFRCIAANFDSHSPVNSLSLSLTFRMYNANKIYVIRIGALTCWKSQIKNKETEQKSVDEQWRLRALNCRKPNENCIEAKMNSVIESWSAYLAHFKQMLAAAFESLERNRSNAITYRSQRSWHAYIRF